MRVPIYQRQENVEAMQAAQVSPLMPAGDYGANTAGVMKSIVDRIQKLQNDTEDARTLELFNKFKTDSQVYHEDPDKGIYNTRLGYNAQGVYNETDQWLRKTGEEYVKGLKSERAKTNFRNMARDYILQRGKQNSQFEANQIKKYRDTQADIAYQQGLNEVALNPYNEDLVEQIKENMMNALELKLRYSSPEERSAALADMENDIASARLSVMLRNNPASAETWYQKNRHLFNAENINKFDTAFEDYRIQKTVDELVKTFPQGHEQEALNFIRDNFSGYREDRIVYGYTSRINENEILENRQNTRLRQDQNNLADSLEAEFFTNGTLPNDEELRQYVNSTQLRADQAERIQNLRTAAASRARIEKRILAENPDFSQDELDEAVMRQMGVTDSDYQKYFTLAVDEAFKAKSENDLDKTLSYFYQNARLTRSDVYRIKQHVKTLDAVQKNYYDAELKDFKKTVENIVENTDGVFEDKAQGILDKFITEAINLNPRSKTYREELLNIKKQILIDAIENSGISQKGFLGFGKNKIGKIFEETQDEKLTSRGIDSFPSLPELKPSNINLNSSDDTDNLNTENTVLSMVEGGSVTSSYNPNRKINGKLRPHYAIDIAATEGTPIKLYDFGIPLTVDKIGTNASTENAGNYIKLKGTYSNGDNIEAVFAHLKNDSMKFAVNDTVNAGDIIAEVGNTGYTGNSKEGFGMWFEGKKHGSHLHFSIKINGKYVNPLKFKPPVINNNKQEKESLEDIFGKIWEN